MKNKIKGILVAVVLVGAVVVTMKMIGNVNKEARDGHAQIVAEQQADDQRRAEVVEFLRSHK